MTGRSFSLEGGKILVAARRRNFDVGCIMFDLDHFKKINDTHGHPAGDHFLRSVAAFCTSELRGRDIFDRVGGEEFAVVLPETSMAETAEIVERLRARFAAAPIVFGGAEIKITASFGATQLTEADGGFDAMLRRADVALYEAKHGGRNRVVSAALDFTPHPVQAVA